MNTFQKARLKLTFWYILISTVLLMVFSIAAINAENKAFARLEEVLSDKQQRPKLSAFLEERIDKFESDFRKRLFMFDLILLIGVSFASYFLSGRTLKPIAEMIRKQEEFSADLSHELRTPLTTISMEIEAIKRIEKQIPKVIQEAFESILEETSRMKGIVDGLLTLVREESYKSKTNWTKFDLSRPVSEVFEQMKPLGQKKRLNLKIEQHKDLFVYGNPEEIKQVVLILLDNAIKYTPNHQMVKVRTVLEGKDVLLSVSDTGTGISEKDLPHIFERFYRGQVSNVAKGSGLGLSIAKKIIERHNGKIWVAGKIGDGSEFAVVLPYHS